MDAIRLEVGAILDRLDARVAKVQRSDRLRGLALALLTGASSWSAVALLAGLLRRDEGRHDAALLKGAIDDAPIGLGFLDRELRLLHVNPPLAAIGGFGDVGGQSIRAAWPVLESRLAAPLDAALNRGITTPDMTVPHDRRPDEGAPEIEGVGLVVMPARPMQPA